MASGAPGYLQLQIMGSEAALEYHDASNQDRIAWKNTDTRSQGSAEPSNTSKVIHCDANRLSQPGSFHSANETLFGP
jgi:hypothetical protein